MENNLLLNYNKRMAKPNKKFHGMLVKPLNGRPKGPKKQKTGWESWRKKTDPDYDKKTYKLSEQEKQLLLFIRMFQYKNRYSPNSTDMVEILGLNRGTAYSYIEKLKNKGYIQIGGRRNYPQILFPKSLQFPWEDYEQFPINIFDIPEGYIPPKKI